jgi:hypothetical protein
LRQSFIVLIAFRAIGVSANRRKFAGVGFGSASVRTEYVFRIDGSGTVRRFGLLLTLEANTRPPSRRIAPRKESVMFMGPLLRKSRRLFELSQYFLPHHGQLKTGPMHNSGHSKFL